MPRTTRTFVAVPIPDERKAKLAQLQEQLGGAMPGVKWVEPENLHVTLAFLGDVDDSDLDKVCRAVGEAAAGFERLDLALQGLGAFPKPDRPRNVWVGVVGPGVEPLGRLQKAIAAAVRRAGYPPDEKGKYHPHITLGRVKPGRGPHLDATYPVRRYQDWSAGAFRVGEVVTFASNLT